MKNTNYGTDEASRMMRRASRLYFAGIGGASLSTLSLYAKARGFAVAGCDRALHTPLIVYLRTVGIPVEEECVASPKEGDLIIYTLGMGEDSPVMQNTLPKLSRAEAMGVFLMEFPTRVGIAGTHGKSTTVGMVASILSHTDTPATLLGGAPTGGAPHGYQKGSDTLVLFEACEYQDSFLSLPPTLAAVTNVEWDHPDYFRTKEDLLRSFQTYMAGANQVVLNQDNPLLMSIAPHSAYTYGFSPKARLRGTVQEGGLGIWEDGALLGSVCLQVPGAYQRENALCAVAVSRRLGVDFSTIQKGLATFSGIGGRMEYIGEVQGAKLYLDYAHHPTQIKEAIACGEEAGGRVLVLYQPHTYTRTDAFWGDFQEALSMADYACLVDIYPARESPIAGVTSKRLAQEVGLDYAPTWDRGVQNLLSRAKKGDVLLLMGAGDIREAKHLFFKK